MGVGVRGSRVECPPSSSFVHPCPTPRGGGRGTLDLASPSRFPSHPSGIHALTLLGRKAPRGAAAPLLASVLEAGAAAEAEAERLVAGGAAAEGTAVLREGAQALRRAAGRAEQVTAFLTRPIRASGASGDGPDAAVALSHAHDYLGLMGHTLVAATWVRLATAAAPRHAAAGGVDGFYAGKLQTALFFLRHELTKTEAMAALMLSADATVHDMRSDWF